jgi:hypothetical protein
VLDVKRGRTQIRSLGGGYGLFILMSTRAPAWDRNPGCD